ncbi:MAG: Dyp-type peroxidase [Nannocystaceae bacterium]|nr:Dyp-type peroxidase [Nannocystaceae bacterium]
MLELSQIQSNILREYRHGTAPAFVHFIFLRFGEAKEARDLIKALYPMVTSCARLDGGVPSVLNIGLAYPAVELFGFGGDARALNERDDEATGTIEAFKCGMRVRAAEILGDDDDSDPSNWEAPYRQGRLHAVLCLNAHTREKLDASLKLVGDAIASFPSVQRVHDEAAADFGGDLSGTEHFGFADGIAQPSVLDSGEPNYAGAGTPGKRRGWAPVKTGEFVLGHLDESGQVQFRSEFFKDGSFMVFRKLQQHVGRFRDYVNATAERSGTDSELVGAKMVGRWKSGAPLMLAPNKDDPALAADAKRNNDFRYKDDKEGKRCPIGAHIRRNNPREDPTGPGTIQTSKHRIIRRSTPYGTRLPEGASDDGQDRGVLFVVINADIARQFEFVQQNWVNSVLSSTVLTLPEDRDPLIGHQRNPDKAGKFLMPTAKRNKPPVIAWSLPRFVTTRGGEYFLLPSLDTLFHIGQGTRPPSDQEACESPAEQHDAPSPDGEVEATVPSDPDPAAGPGDGVVEPDPPAEPELVEPPAEPSGPADDDMSR